MGGCLNKSTAAAAPSTSNSNGSPAKNNVDVEMSSPTGKSEQNSPPKNKTTGNDDLKKSHTINAMHSDSNVTIAVTDGNNEISPLHSTNNVTNTNSNDTNNNTNLNTNTNNANTGIGSTLTSFSIHDNPAASGLRFSTVDVSIISSSSSEGNDKHSDNDDFEEETNTLDSDDERPSVKATRKPSFSGRSVASKSSAATSASILALRISSAYYQASGIVGGIVVGEGEEDSDDEQDEGEEQQSVTMNNTNTNGSNSTRNSFALNNTNNANNVKTNTNNNRDISKDNSSLNNNTTFSTASIDVNLKVADLEVKLAAEAETDTFSTEEALYKAEHYSESTAAASADSVSTSTSVEVSQQPEQRDAVSADARNFIVDAVTAALEETAVKVMVLTENKVQGNIIVDAAVPTQNIQHVSAAEPTPPSASCSEIVLTEDALIVGNEQGKVEKVGVEETDGVEGKEDKEEDEEEDLYKSNNDTVRFTNINHGSSLRSLSKDEVAHEDKKKAHFLQLGRAAVVTSDPQKPASQLLSLHQKSLKARQMMRTNSNNTTNSSSGSSNVGVAPINISNASRNNNNISINNNSSNNPLAKKKTMGKLGNATSSNSSSTPTDHVDVDDDGHTTSRLTESALPSSNSSNSATNINGDSHSNNVTIDDRTSVSDRFTL